MEWNRKKVIRLAKGAKETFGWVIVGENRELVIPPAAWMKYGFKVGDQAIFVSGSKKSGGFGLTNLDLQEGLSFRFKQDRILGYDKFTKERMVFIPQTIHVKAGDRLLTVFGSRFALGFISRGPIYQEAIQFTGLDQFKWE